jgi:cytochrome c oxidase subunit 2
MEPWYLARQLENFAAGTRGLPADDESGHEMGPVGMRLKHEGAIDAAVQFIGKLESKRPPPTVSGDVANGKKLYANCVSCHGAQGEGNASLNSPALAARSDWYLVTQLANFRKGVRGADERDTYGAQMRAIVATLPDDKAITDVVAYINTLK